MKKKILILFMTCFFVMASSTEIVADIYIDDGLSHTLGSTSPSDMVWVDSNIANQPGSHVEMVGGEVKSLNAYNNATVDVFGGTVIYSLMAHDEVSVNRLATYDNASAVMAGGRTSMLDAEDDGSITFKGGTTSMIIASHSGLIYIYGKDFQINGQYLSYGDKFSDFVPLRENRYSNGIVDDYYVEDYYSGQVTGILDDGSMIDSVFYIYNVGTFEGDADIIFVPEPITLALFGIGVLLLRKR